MQYLGLQSGATYFFYVQTPFIEAMLTFYEFIRQMSLVSQLDLFWLTVHTLIYVSNIHVKQSNQHPARYHSFIQALFSRVTTAKQPGGTYRKSQVGRQRPRDHSNPSLHRTQSVVNWPTHTAHVEWQGRQRRSTLVRRCNTASCADETFMLSVASWDVTMSNSLSVDDMGLPGSKVDSK